MSRVKAVFRIVCITTIFHVHWDPSGGQQANKKFVRNLVPGLRKCVGFQVTKSVISCGKTWILLSL